MKLKLCVLAVIAGLFFTATAFGGDGKVYPGMMGVRANESNPVPRMYLGTLQNPSTGWLIAYLPVIHDSIDHNIHDGWVKVIDMNYNSDFYCTLQTRYPSGCSLYGTVSAAQTSSGANCAAQKLTFPSLSRTSESHYYYYCQIPPVYSGNRSSVVSYYVKENT